MEELGEVRLQPLAVDLLQYRRLDLDGAAPILLAIHFGLQGGHLSGFLIFDEVYDTERALAQQLLGLPLAVPAELLTDPYCDLWD